MIDKAFVLAKATTLLYVLFIKTDESCHEFFQGPLQGEGVLNSYEFLRSDIQGQTFVSNFLGSQVDILNNFRELVR